MTEEPRATPLKLCPFCGGDARCEGEALYCCVRCTRCNASVGLVLKVDETAAEAIAAWNRRATPAVRDGLVERLLKAANDFEGCRFNHANHEESDCEPHWSCQEEMEDAAKVAREAADALSLRPAETRVKIKPIRWEEQCRAEYLHPYTWHGHGTRAHEYTIFQAKDGYTLQHHGKFAKLEEAQAAAQSDFEKRIKASISEPARAEEGKEPVASRLTVTDDAVEAAAWAFDDYGGWRDISTAPKDGTRIIGSSDDDTAYICAWFVDEDDSGDWLQYGSDVVRPTRWLPTPPSRPSNEAGE